MAARGGHVKASGELGDEWVLMGDTGKIQGAPDHIRRIRRKDDTKGKHPRFKCLKCTGDASMSKQMNRGGAENDRLAAEFIHAHSHCVRTNPTRQTILEEFQVGHSDIGTRMKVLRTDVLDHLLAFVAVGNISFRCVESPELWHLLKAAMQLGQAFPRVDPDVFLERIGPRR
jgi:hypothetical protein